MQSQNGYQVLDTNRTTGALPRLRKWIIPGTGRHVFLRDGSTGFLLAHVALWFHENVEKIDNATWDEWGWAVRNVRGSVTSVSNHSSGTAVDINATKHPRGVATAKTFSKAEIDKIHTQLKVYGGCIRWGGDYTKSPADGMHFEIDKNLAAVEKVARDLWDSPYGARVLAANDGAAEVIWDGKVPTLPKPAPAPDPKPAPKKRLVVDFSYGKDAMRKADLKGANVVGVARYLSASFKPEKALTEDERAWHHSESRWILPIFERSAGRAGEGFDAGVTDALTMEAEADALGFPKGVALFYAVDFDATLAQVAPYFEGINSANRRPVGVYGSAGIIDGVVGAKLAAHGWQTRAWSGKGKDARVSKHAKLLQEITHTVTINGAAANDWDENTILGGVIPVWNPGEAPTSAPPVVPPAAPVVVSVVEANVKSNPKMPQADVVSDIANVKTLPQAGAKVYLGAEIIAGRYADAWAAGLGTTFCAEQECPISLSPADWTVIDSTVHKAHGGLLHVTPARYISTVRATSVARPDVKVAFVATHFISGAWSNNFPTTKAWRLTRWSSHLVQLQDTVRALVDDGFTVVVGADTNRSAMPPLHIGQVIAVEHGIDHLWVIPAAGIKVTVTGKTVTKAGALNTDHSAIAATITIA